MTDRVTAPGAAVSHELFTCESWPSGLCSACDAANDAIVAGQDTFTRMMDEAGMCRIARDYRGHMRRIAGDRAWARFRLSERMVAERPATAPGNPRRPWSARDAWKDTRQGFTRFDLPAPDSSLLPETMAIYD